MKRGSLHFNTFSAMSAKIVTTVIYPISLLQFLLILCLNDIGNDNFEFQLDLVNLRNKSSVTTIIRLYSA